MTCTHNFIIGDNYGETCGDCGEVISGYGEGASQSFCDHRYVSHSQDKTDKELQICLYCLDVREKQ